MRRKKFPIWNEASTQIDPRSIARTIQAVASIFLSLDGNHRRASHARFILHNRPRRRCGSSPSRGGALRRQSEMRRLPWGAHPSFRRECPLQVFQGNLPIPRSEWLRVMPRPGKQAHRRRRRQGSVYSQSRPRSSTLLKLPPRETRRVSSSPASSRSGGTNELCRLS